MNILFIGPYRQDDEWGRKSRSLLKTLHRPDHKVTSRPLFLSTSPSYNAYAEPAEFVTCKEYDVLIQFSLQPLVTYAGNFSKRVLRGELRIISFNKKFDPPNRNSRS